MQQFLAKAQTFTAFRGSCPPLTRDYSELGFSKTNLPTT